MKRLNLRGRTRHSAARRLEPVATALVMVLGIHEKCPLTHLPGVGPDTSGSNAELIARWLAAQGHDWPCGETLSQLPQRVAELIELLEAGEAASAKEVSHVH
jgi:hypothetical protein